MNGQEIRRAEIGRVCGELLPRETGLSDTWPERLAGAIGGVKSRLRQYRKSLNDPAAPSSLVAARLGNLESAVAKAVEMAESFRSCVEGRVSSSRE